MDPMTTRRRMLVWCAWAALSLPGAAAAVPLTVYNTGVDNSSNAWGTGGVPDIHYSLIVQPGSATAQTVTDTSYPFPPWIANNSGSRWIGPAADSNGPTGNYVYRTTFNVPANAILSTVSVSGDWATDDPGTDIRINNISTGQTSNGYGSFASFSVTSGFVFGANTLDFYVTNVPQFPNPTGLRVDHISGTYQVPEPHAAFLATMAASATALVRRRRRQKRFDIRS
jgi:hypothetical protein